MIYDVKYLKIHKNIKHLTFAGNFDQDVKGKIRIQLQFNLDIGSITDK